MKKPGKPGKQTKHISAEIGDVIQSGTQMVSILRDPATKRKISVTEHLKMFREKLVTFAEKEMIEKGLLTIDKIPNRR
jgi:hypothetical protein